MSTPANIIQLFLNNSRPALRDLGDPAGELSSAEQLGFVSDLRHLGIITFEGEDAGSFLQSQLSCDVDALASTPSSAYGAYCSPKGRMLANFLLWKEGAMWRMVLDRSLLESVQKRLSMYVLRAKVRISVLEDMVLLGTGGFTGQKALRDAIGMLPGDVHSVLMKDEVTIVGVHGGRYLLMTVPAKAMQVWAELAEHVPVTGTAPWELSDIHNGIPWISKKTQDQFVPQMINLELIGGVSFKKGCYPGQEIVARTQHLGKIKRRMYLAHVSSKGEAGDELYSDDVNGQSNGMVVNAVPAAGGGSDMLVVVQRESAESSRVHSIRPDGPLLEFMQLPYLVG